MKFEQKSPMNGILKKGVAGGAGRLEIIIFIVSVIPRDLTARLY